ncbi:MAG: FAD-binding oxidoreductase [Oligoflexia bacterium]|nr:FAD-binding oxidoreductase [Oligoflexia bacterium]
MIDWDSLAQSLEGELSLDSKDIRAHQEDASIFQQTPTAVLYPKNTNDLKKILSFAREHKLTIHPWGVGTSRGGQPLGSGLILNFRKHWKKILSYDEASHEVTVEPGVLYSELQSYLKDKKRSFTPDPSYPHCTIGGMIANNASGIHALRWGGSIDLIRGIEFLGSDGELHSSDQEDRLSKKLSEILLPKRTEIESSYPKVEKNSSGYALDRVFTQSEKIDLAKLFTGSEGTLGLISKIRLATNPLCPENALALCYFSSLEDALQAALDLRTYNISACELIDRPLLKLHSDSENNHLEHAKDLEKNEYLETFFQTHAEALLIVEWSTEEGEESAKQQLNEACAKIKNCTQFLLAKDEKEKTLFWDLRRHSSPILNKLKNGKLAIKPLWAMEDVSLPPENLIAYVQEQQKLFQEFGIECSFFGHAAASNLHIDPVHIDLREHRENDDLNKRFLAVTEASYKLTIKYGGSISGEHGDGLMRTPYLHWQFPKLMPIFKQIKELFDPENIFNPGKIVPFDYNAKTQERAPHE